MTTALRPSSLCRAKSAVPAQSKSLIEAVRSATRALDAGTLKAVAPQDAGLACQPRALLTLLTFCYACKIYGSADIAAQIKRDENFRLLGQQDWPDVRMIQSFRRENRDALQACLAAALRFQIEQKIAQGIVTGVSQPRIMEEARRRVIMAMFSDSMETNKDQTTDTPTDLCYLFAKQR